VQSKTISAIDAQKVAIITAQTILLQNNDENFDKLFEECVNQANAFGVPEPALDRRVRPPRRLDDGPPGHHPISCRDNYRQQYNEFLDTAASTISNRFNNASYELFSKMENLFVKAAGTGAVNTEDVEAACDHFDGDLKPDNLMR
jgi:hypothetical protein